MNLNEEKDNDLKKDNQFFQTEYETKNWLDFMKIEKYSINPDLTVDVDGGVDISNSNLTALPVQFGRVNVSFSCDHNQLTSLKGSPYYVGGNFSCSSNQLGSLNNGPERVVFDYDCRDNLLDTLKGAPSVVGNFDCGYNNLTTLNGSPKIVTGSFNCSENRLTTLDNAPDRVNGKFILNDNSFDNKSLMDMASEEIKHYINTFIKAELPKKDDFRAKIENTKLDELPKNEIKDSIIRMDPSEISRVIAEAKNSVKEPELKSNVVSIAEVKNDMTSETQLANAAKGPQRRLKL